MTSAKDTTAPPTPASQPKVPFGVGTLLGECFSILFKHIGKVIVIGFLPSLLGYLVPALMIGLVAAPTLGSPQEPGMATVLAPLLVLAMQVLVFAITVALLVQLAYDAKLKRQVKLWRYIRPALSSVLPITILSIVMGITLFIGLSLFGMLGEISETMMLITLPVIMLFSLWIFATFSTMAPAVAIEGVGLRGLNRSYSLTQKYRWPIAGVLVLTAICYLLINAVAVFLSGIAALGGGIALALVLFAALSAIGTGILGVVVSLIYARLREIKEGIGVDEIVAVFD